MQRQSTSLKRSTPGLTNTAPHVTGRQLATALGGWIGLAAVLGATTILGLRTLAPGWDPTVGPAVIVVAEVYLALAAALLLACGGWAGLRQRLAFRFTSWRDIGLSIGLFGAWVALSVACYGALALALGWSTRHTLVAFFSIGTDMNRLGTASAVSLFFIILRAGLLAGIGEELLFRGALYGWLRSRWSAGSAIVVTTIAFTAGHGLPIVFPAVILFGLLSGWLRERTRSTLNTLVMHVLVDTSMLAVAWVLAFRDLTAVPGTEVAPLA
jgi:membrane protease YdiL (CAAX protease family)